MRWTTSLTISLCLALGAPLLAGCGETNRASFERLKPQYDVEREALRALVHALPAPASAPGALPASLKPAPVYDEKVDSYNTAFLSIDQIDSPNVDIDHAKGVGLLLNSDLVWCLGWTAPNPRLSEEALDRRGKLGQECENALVVPYVVVLRTVSYQPVVATDAAHFTGGTLILDGFLFDHASRKQLGAFRVTAHPNETVDYRAGKTQSQTKELERWGYSSLWQNARTEVIKAMGKIGGARMVLK
jgi:hypothetical protein